MITRIISGGQTGADIAGLRAARRLHVPTGGYAPKGWRTEKGPNIQLGVVYGLIEASSPDYTERTELNVLTSDGTVIFGINSSGSKQTEEFCNDYRKPCLWIPWPKPGFMGNQEFKFRMWVERNGIHVLNVAGNRESRNPGIGDAVEGFLRDIIPFINLPKRRVS